MTQLVDAAGAPEGQTLSIVAYHVLARLLYQVLRTGNGDPETLRPGLNTTWDACDLEDKQQLRHETVWFHAGLESKIAASKGYLEAVEADHAWWSRELRDTNAFPWTRRDEFWVTNFRGAKHHLARVRSHLEHWGGHRLPPVPPNNGWTRDPKELTAEAFGDYVLSLYPWANLYASMSNSLIVAYVNTNSLVGAVMRHSRTDDTAFSSADYIRAHQLIRDYVLPHLRHAKAEDRFVALVTEYPFDEELHKDMHRLRVHDYAMQCVNRLVDNINGGVQVNPGYRGLKAIREVADKLGVELPAYVAQLDGDRWAKPKPHKRKYGRHFWATIAASVVGGAVIALCARVRHRRETLARAATTA